MNSVNSDDSRIKTTPETVSEHVDAWILSCPIKNQMVTTSPAEVWAVMKSDDDRAKAIMIALLFNNL